jgi:hypothetical protein
MPKSTNAVVSDRIHEVLQLRLHGAELADIVRYSSEKGWGVGERQIQKYIAAGDRLLAEAQEQDRGKLLARHIAQRRLLFARCMKINDYKTALQVAKDEAELEQLYGPTKIAPTDPTGERPYDPTAGLGPLIPELRAAMERLGSPSGESDSGQAADSTSLSGGLGADHDGSGDDAGLLASDVAPLR